MLLTMTRTTTPTKTRAPRKRATAAPSEAVKRSTKVPAGAAKKSAQPPAIAAKGDARVAASLESLLQQLAMDAYTKAEKSGDRESYEREDRGVDELYDEYWEKEYRWIFFSAFFDISPALRSEPGLRKLAQSAFDVFQRALSDERACFAYSKRHWKTQDRLRLLSFYDGSSERPLVIDSFAAVRKKVAREKL
jgi:hypothetical protein